MRRLRKDIFASGSKGKYMIAFFQGFGIGGSLIAAIGAQNSFVLAQGVRKQYFFLVPLLCSIIDIALISAGAAGVGTFVSTHPKIAYYAAIGGTFFLTAFGIKSLLSAFSTNILEKSATQNHTLRSIVLTTLALSLLNPHVYFDTIIMLGSISGQYSGGLRLAFAFGACSASVLWFFALSFGGTMLEPFFRKPFSWRILDVSICLVMWTIAWSIWPGI
jgi:L-lysine exporter family protein LysE/ArgO